MPNITLYTVYDHPKDYPDEFVIRRWEAGAVELPGTGLEGTGIFRGQVTPELELFARGSTLKAVRDQIPPGLFNIGRESDDDPCIVETWV